MGYSHLVAGYSETFFDENGDTELARLVMHDRSVLAVEIVEPVDLALFEYDSECAKLTTYSFVNLNDVKAFIEKGDKVLYCLRMVNDVPTLCRAPFAKQTRRYELRIAEDGEPELVKVEEE